MKCQLCTKEKLQWEMHSKNGRKSAAIIFPYSFFCQRKLCTLFSWDFYCTRRRQLQPVPRTPTPTSILASNQMANVFIFHIYVVDHLLIACGYL